ncbi:MAG: hypothetical protein CM15mP98_09550 [Paracoccaceae bacterium]|nr:MAG: hypothetical protein CM15mP98_09550 [Paracoccaceae bacterium]
MVVLLLWLCDKLPSEINENNKPTEIIKLGDEAMQRAIMSELETTTPP